MGELPEPDNRDSSTSVPVYDTPKQLLSRFYFLQEERVQTYQMFEEGFVAYLKGAPNYNFPMYRQLVFEITETFNKISQEIMEIKDKFSDNNSFLTIGSIMEKIQVAERTKLEVTAKLQISRQKDIDEKDNDTIGEEIEQLKQQLQEKTGDIIDEMEELKYESEDLYTSDMDNDTECTDTTSDIYLDR